MHYVPTLSMRREVARDLRSVLDAGDRGEADQRLGQLVKKYADSAPRLAAWLEKNVPEALTVLSLPAAHRRKRSVSNFSDYYGDVDYDPIDRLAGEGEALRERVEDILCHCETQVERDVVNGIADAIEDGKRPNQIYLTLEHSQSQILEAWKAVAAHYLKVLVSRGESLPGKPGGNQRRPPLWNGDSKNAA